MGAHGSSRSSLRVEPLREDPPDKHARFENPRTCETISACLILGMPVWVSYPQRLEARQSSDLECIVPDPYLDSNSNCSKAAFKTVNTYTYASKHGEAVIYIQSVL